MKLAVLSCKSYKEDHPCSAELMYMKSALHKIQVEFVKKYYDGYIILSSKHGVLYPYQVIEPYKSMLSTASPKYKKSAIQSDPSVHIHSKEETMEWAQNVITHEVWSKYTHADFHTSDVYYKPIKNNIPIPHTKIKFANAQIVIMVGRYKKIYDQLINGEEVDFGILSEKVVSKFPEKRRTHYHHEYPSFFGWARELSALYPEQKLDECCIMNIDKINAEGERYRHAGRQHKGWVVNEDELCNLTKKEDGKWAYKKI